MFNLLTSPSTRRTLRGLAGLVADAVRSVVNPASLVTEVEAPAVVEAPDPAGVLGEDELPAVEDIEAAAKEYATAADMGRAADRRKRKARKLIDLVPSGIWGRYAIERVTSSRQTIDVEAVRATYKRLGLGEVPMRPTAPSLRVTELAPADTAGAELAGATA